MVWPAWLALLVALVILLVAWRHRFAARLGWRNAVRHKRQTAIVVVGLLVGTAVVSASLTTGDSLETGLKQTSIALLGEMDVLVRVPGELFVPEGMLEELVADPLPEHVAGASRTVIARAAVEAPETDRYQGRVPVVGFDAEEDAVFGPFIDAGTGQEFFGEDLGPQEVLVNERLAGRLHVGPGDTVELVYRPAFQPFLPVVSWANGTLVAASATPDPLGGWTYHHGPDGAPETLFEVPEGAQGVIGFVLWQDPAGLADLDLELVDPEGESHRNDTGTPGGGLPLPLPDEDPDAGASWDAVFWEDPSQYSSKSTAFSVEEHAGSSVVLLDRDDAMAGEWSLRVHAKHALQQDYVAGAVVLRPEFDLERALRALKDLQELLGETFDELMPDPVMGGEGRSAPFTVQRVVENEGKGGFFGSPTLFMDRSVAQSLYEVEGQANWLKLTHKAPGLGGVVGSDETLEFLEERLEALKESHGDDPSSPQANLRAQAIKKEFLERSEEAAGLFTRFLALVGSFTLVAGMLLIVNLFTMLGEQRRRELAMVRAIGLDRFRVAFTLIFEGGVYTVVAAAVGAVVGIGVAGLFVVGLNTFVPPDSLFRVPLAPRGGSLLVAFAVGALLTFATVAFAAYRASRFDVASGLRDEEDPVVTRDRRRRHMQILLFSGILALTLAGALAGSFLALSVGPLLVLFAAGPLLVPVLGRQRAWRTVSLLIVLVVLAGLLLLRTPLGWEGDLSTLARALLLIIAGSVFLVNAPAIPRLISRVFSRSVHSASVLRVALAYPLKRPLRTGLTVSMYSLVILVLVVFSVMFTVMTPDPTRESGGYDLVGRAPVLVEDDAALQENLREVEGVQDPFAPVTRVDVLAEHREFGQERILLDGEPPSGMARGSTWFIGFDADFAEHNEYGLYDWDRDRWDTQREVWQAVAEDSELVLVSYALVGDPSQPRGGQPAVPGVLTLNTTSGPREYRVAGVTDQVHLAGVWTQRAGLERVFPQADGLYLFRLQDGTDVYRAAGDLERALRGMGMMVTSVEEEARHIEQEANRMYMMLSMYLGLGILVGVASLGIVTSRAVLERRRETGMMRAIGYTPRRVGAVLLTETLYLLGLAIALGVGLGLLVARAIYEAELSGLPGAVFVVPWARILVLLGIALVATLIAVWVPVHQAGRTAPSEAVRKVD